MTAPASADRAGRFLIWSAHHLVDVSTAGPAPLEGMTDADWSRVLSEGQVHAVLPIVDRACVGLPGVPDLVREDLATWSAEHVRRSLRITGELIGILGRLRAAGIEAVPWKGPLLAERAYGDLRLRWYQDLDLIVERDRLRDARDVLFAEGFRPAKSMTDHQEEVYVEHQGELELVRDADGVMVELHWVVVPTYYAPPRVDRAIRSRLTTAQLARATVPALSIEDELEALCVHGSKHRWERLLWIVDIAMLTSRRAINWDALLGRAQAHGNRRMVALGLLLARSVVGVPLPADVMADVERDRSAITLEREARRMLFVPPEARPHPFLFHARMRERRRDQARYLLGAMFTPSGADWERMALPGALFPLYAITRPIRLAIKFSRRPSGAAEG